MKAVLHIVCVGRVIYGLMGRQIDGLVKCVTIVHMLVANSCVIDAAAAARR